ncbi:xanthine dehydrogenase family protein subunit M [Geodermatophilus sabuli]|uniref:Xanthine dehydrogenase family protein subunit M n=1 Tax=Geodermatophilus sabuli TaxID=1564158 RepID=A0A7K3W3E0_9ACTN|nr:xanthine dehydrogenase family protein subunit M [Geodermatophilus sabuli]
MIPAEFDYVAASSLEDALRLLGEHGDEAKLLAGGHSLIPLMKFRLAAPSVLVDISRLPELRTLRPSDGHLRLGAGLRIRDLELSPVVREQVPLLAAAAASVGDRQVRARATVGGTVVHGDPAADIPAVLVTLDATLVLRGPAGERELSAAEFFVDFWETACGLDEVLVEIVVPALPGRRWAFEKFRQRSQDWATVGVAVQETADGEHAVGLVNMAPVPWRASPVEDALRSGAAVPEAAGHAAEGAAPPSDLRGDSAYRAHLAQVLTAKALTTAGAGS